MLMLVVPSSEHSCENGDDEGPDGEIPDCSSGVAVCHFVQDAGRANGDTVPGAIAAAYSGGTEDSASRADRLFAAPAPDAGHDLLMAGTVVSAIFAGNGYGRGNLQRDPALAAELLAVRI